MSYSYPNESSRRSASQCMRLIAFDYAFDYVLASDKAILYMPELVSAGAPCAVIVQRICSRPLNLIPFDLLGLMWRINALASSPVNPLYRILSPTMILRYLAWQCLPMAGLAKMYCLRLPCSQPRFCRRGQSLSPYIWLAPSLCPFFDRLG